MVNHDPTTPQVPHRLQDPQVLEQELEPIEQSPVVEPKVRPILVQTHHTRRGQVIKAARRHA